MSIDIAAAASLLGFLCDAALIKPLVFALGTVDSRGVARVRSVVLRDTNPGAGTLWLSTHAASEKVKHLRANPMAEMTRWFEDDHLQLRLEVRWTVVDAAFRGDAAIHPTRDKAWAAHSSATQAMFLWPAPGRPFSGKTVVSQRVAFPSGAPAAFTVLVGSIRHIEALRIEKAAHERWRHSRTRKGWKAARITP